MTRVYEDNSYAIGNTPLVRINHIQGKMPVNILAKIEGRNPSYSVKCRIGAAMIWDAEKKGILKPGMAIVEPTSGNTGIALAYVSAARGYKLTLTMPDTMSAERRRILAAFGAELVLTPGEKGMTGAIEEAEKIFNRDPQNIFMPQQFKNPANPNIHEKTTGPEIWNDTNGDIDVLVAGVGTGGTITGISRFIKQVKGRKIITVAVEPVTSSVITQKLAGKALEPGKHKIQGIGAGFIPDVLDLSLIDRVVAVKDEEAFEYSRRLAKEEGIIAGISSGAAVAGVMKLMEEEEYHNKTIVVVLPDSGERYLSTPLFL